MRQPYRFFIPTEKDLAIRHYRSCHSVWKNGCEPMYVAELPENEHEINSGIEELKKSCLF
jgi:hypothetical protein